jgi:hypothetical protein
MFLKKISIFFSSLLIAVIISCSSVMALAQDSSALKFEIPKVSKNGESFSTKKIDANNYQFEGVLTLDDEIRYRWENAFLDLFYQANPQPGTGWLKIYLNDDSTESNLLGEHGSSPLPVAKIAERLPEGDVKIMMVYIDSQTKLAKVPVSKVSLKFKFQKTSIKPRLEVVNPKPGVVLANGINHEFKLKLNNFSLTSSTKPENGTGKLNVYYNEVTPNNLIATINNSVEKSEKEYFVAFDSKALEFGRIPDSDNVNLIFVLVNVNGDLTEFRDELRVKTNYNNSINLGLPRITFVEPRKDRLDLNVNGNKKFLIQIDNFTLLKDFESGAEVNGKQGYLQIFVDNSPVKTIWSKTEFSLNEIGYFDEDGGQKEVRVQLVNPDFSKLAPEAVDNVGILYLVEKNDSITAETVTGGNDLWRIVIIVLVLIMILGGILLLVVKG